MNIDHFMYAGPQLGPLCASFQALTGVEPEPGGQHPQLGTCNRLVGSGGPLYLELIAPDPLSTTASAMRSGIEALPRPGLHANFAVVRCEAGHPSAVELSALWAELDMGVELHASDAPYMRLLVQTTRGTIALTSNQ